MVLGRRQQAEQVNKDSVKALCGRRYGLQLGVALAVDFGDLTEEASARLIPYLLPHAWPYRSSTGDAMGTQDPGVVEGVVMC